MKKRLSVLSVVPTLFFAVFFISNSVAHAAATLPSTAVWFTPATATVGSAITLNALVYNDQATSATVTVGFTTPTAKIATATASIPAETAKTFSVTWTMPSTSTVVTASVTAALNSAKQSIPTLLGTIGTTTVGATTTTTVVDGITFPGSAQIGAWFSSLFSKLETFRTKEAVIFTAQRDAVKAKIASSVTQAFQTPMNYVVLIYTTCLSALFSNAALFYIAVIIVVLLVLKFIVNLV